MCYRLSRVRRGDGARDTATGIHLKGEINVPVIYVGRSFNYDCWKDLPLLPCSERRTNPLPISCAENDFTRHNFDWHQTSVNPFTEELARARLAHSPPGESSDGTTDDTSDYNRSWSDPAEEPFDADTEESNKDSSESVAASPSPPLIAFQSRPQTASPGRPETASPNRPLTAYTDKDSGIGSLPNLETASDDGSKSDDAIDGSHPEGRDGGEGSSVNSDPTDHDAAKPSTCEIEAEPKKCTCKKRPGYVFSFL